MNNSVYQINKGINASVTFKGIKAQYILYLAVGLVALLVLFAIVYICGLPVFICLALVASGGTALFMYVFKMSKTYGEHGLMKKLARKKLPKVIKGCTVVELKSLLSYEKPF